jgi:Zn finger protein HypA/HybF involved in hydrogenase expression
MKIVDEKPFNYEFKCRQCSSRLIAEIDDVRVGDFGSSDMSHYKYYVVCPVCHADHVLKDSLVPPHVRNVANKKGRR